MEKKLWPSQNIWTKNANYRFLLRSKLVPWQHWHKITVDVSSIWYICNPEMIKEKRESVKKRLNQITPINPFPLNRSLAANLCHDIWSNSLPLSNVRVHNVMKSILKEHSSILKFIYSGKGTTFLKLSTKIIWHHIST